MHMNTKGLLLTAVLAGVLSTPFHAQAEAFDVQSVVAKQERIRRAVQTSSAGFSEVPSATKNELLQRQDALIALLGTRSYADLSEQERAQALEQIAWIDNVATKAADERVVCERVRTAGSNMMQRVCTTARSQRESREAARTMLMSGPRNSPLTDNP
jgi:hypothetical protein